MLPAIRLSATATLLAPLAGTWTGTGNASAGEQNVSVSATFSRSPTANDMGTYYVSGTLNYNSPACAASGIEIDGQVAGSNVYLTFDESNDDPVWFSFIGSLDKPPSSATYSGAYQTISGPTTIPGCVGDSGSIQFTEQ